MAEKWVSELLLSESDTQTQKWTTSVSYPSFNWVFFLFFYWNLFLPFVFIYRLQLTDRKRVGQKEREKEWNVAKVARIRSPTCDAMVSSFNRAPNLFEVFEAVCFYSIFIESRCNYVAYIYSVAYFRVRYWYFKRCIKFILCNISFRMLEVFLAIPGYISVATAFIYTESTSHRGILGQNAPGYFGQLLKLY